MEYIDKIILYIAESSSFVPSISMFQILLSLCLLTSALLVSLSSNPVESVLFLVLTFIISGMMLMMLFSEFFGIALIIIYVGAVAVLFLFVIMMLNIKDLNNNAQVFINLFKTKLQAFCVIVCLLYSFFVVFVHGTGETFSKTESNQNIFLVDNLDGIVVLGQVLYNYYIDCFLLAGLILLVSLLGSISLTLTYNNNKKLALANKQLSRSSKFLSFVK